MDSLTDCNIGCTTVFGQCTEDSVIGIIERLIDRIFHEPITS